MKNKTKKGKKMNTKNFKFNCGDMVQDKVTEVKGVIVCISYYMSGCIRYGIQPKSEKDKDKAPESFYVDEQQLKLIKENYISITPQAVGGYRDIPKSNRL